MSRYNTENVESSSSDGQVSEDELAFDYIKSADFKTIWADGAIGGITPSGNIHVALYSERFAIPKREIFKVDWDSGELNEQNHDKTESRNAIVREMSCDLVLQPKVAKALAEWIFEYLHDLDAEGEEE